MKVNLFVVSILITLLGLSSCVTRDQINYLQEGERIPVYADTVEFKDYQLQKGDYLYVRVLSLNEDDMVRFNGGIVNNNNTLSILNSSSDNAAARLYMYLVRENGCIEFPYVDPIYAEGLTVREVKDSLTASMQKMMSEFSVDVRLMNRTFSIIGEAGNGRYSLSKEKLNIFEALAMSGGLHTYSKVSKVQLIRETSEGTIIKTFDLRAKTIINSEYYYIQPNDVLYIPGRNSRIFGISNYVNLISVVMSTVSFGLFIYSLPKMFK